MKHPPKKEDLALARRCAEVIRRIYPDAEVILYGSRARGNPQPDSDLDLLVLSPKKLSWREEARIIDILYPIELETGMVLSALVEHKGTWRTAAYQVMPLAQGIAQDGVAL
jgi:predicted nucleotidyltransferase